MKKPGLDECTRSSNRPISNLSVLSKLLERFVARQLVSYFDTYRLFPATQSAFRRGHSTKTATIPAFSDLLDAVDRGNTAALVLLDLSAAFDTVDHEILLERLRVTFGVDSFVLKWFRRQHVRCRGTTFSTTDVICGVPQGSVLGPNLFIIYTADLELIVAEHGLSLHQYADDSQVYGSCPPAATSALLTDISRVVDVLSRWMSSNQLQLNADTRSPAER